MRPHGARFRRLALLGVAAALVALGLALRLGPGRLGFHRLPLVVHHSGGGLLWGAMIYALVAAARPPRWGVAACLAATLAVAAAVEGSRLVHGSALDAFRQTLAGQWLLGRVFSAWNIAVDVLGALLAAAATARLVPPSASRREGGDDRRQPEGDPRDVVVDDAAVQPVQPGEQRPE